MKVLFIAPHLSTGGLPQYLLKQIQTFKHQNDIYCIEWENITGNIFTVQRKQIQEILGPKMITLDVDKHKILDVINKLSPDVIHFQEIPESFISSDLLDHIYSKNRKHFIVVTTHSSYTDPSRLKYLADKFILVCEWSKKRFTEYFKQSIPCDTWEYPVEKIEYDKFAAKKELRFDINKKHVLHVGLFTPGKNQKHIIEVARKCLNYNIQFHFVGNQAENFKSYWEPLMKDFPSNCVWHNERVDVDKFYKACDLFYFPSLFELCPISIKEALSYNLPIFISQLETYENKYDNIATYIDEDINKSADKLLLFLNYKKDINLELPILHILTDIDSDREVKSMQSLTKLTDFNCRYIPIISKRYTELPPSDTCKYPEKISMEPGGKLTPGHYGCYLGHHKAFEKGLEIDNDHMMIFECDAIIDVTNEQFIDKIKFAIEKIKIDDLLMFSFGYHNNTHIIEKKNDYWIVNGIFGAHAYLIPKKSYNIINNIYKNEKWNVADLFFNENFKNYKIGIFEKPITKQAAGFSILDKIYNHDRY